MSQDDVANAINTTKSNISKYECGKLYPNKKNSIQLATLFKLDSKYFFDEYFIAIESFHKNLYDLLDKSSISKNKLCSLIGISKRTLYRYIYNHELPTRKIYLKFKMFLDITK